MNEAPADVVMATAWYPPYDLGGTEVYLEGLVQELALRGLKCAVLVPRAAGAPDRYEHRGVRVWTYPVELPQARQSGSSTRRHGRFDHFEALLRQNPRAIYHQHSWTTGCGLDHLRAARAQGLRTVLTFHVAGTVCLRGTLLRFGEVPCDGLVEEIRCGTCWAESRGAPRTAAWAIGRLPRTLAARAIQGRTRLATALSARALAIGKAQELDEAFELSDRLVAVCQWLADTLTRNGAPPDKLALSRHGLAASYLAEAKQAAAQKRSEDTRLRLVYLGRWDRAKGIHVAVAALRSLRPETPVELSIHAIGAAEDDGYEAEVRALAEDDPRIRFLPPLPRGDIAAALAVHDVLLVPSLWLETGPLVVLEAQAAGLYVLGSDLGGIAELLVGAGGGELLRPGSVPDWAKAIARLVARKCQGPLPKFRGHLRSQADVADDMISLYASLPPAPARESRLVKTAP
ncbi:glycosyltransferase family 4 protein [Labrys sp. KNU-23]|uniref:glycosyltransferase n=1 Tax=Labrys sp. KNU-23 TaxID=2789216 RepID=UPI0011EDA979|nr:glycosyltransferase [Labrys sp. KNU-23]QEN85702.1 glycosyltransferase family 4 protein [Labrys sp. KNU-23]